MVKILTIKYLSFALYLALGLQTASTSLASPVALFLDMTVNNSPSSSCISLLARFEGI